MGSLGKLLLALLLLVVPLAGSVQADDAQSHQVSAEVEGLR